MHKIQIPAGLGGRVDQGRRSRPCYAPPTLSLVHRQAFFAIEPVDAVEPRRFAALAQQDEQASIAEAPPCVGEIAQSRPTFRVWRASLAVADRPAIRFDNGAGPPLRKAHHGLKLRDAFALGDGPTIFSPEAHEARLRRASARPKASSASRSPPRVASVLHQVLINEPRPALETVGIATRDTSTRSSPCRSLRRECCVFAGWPPRRDRVSLAVEPCSAYLLSGPPTPCGSTAFSRSISFVIQLRWGRSLRRRLE